MNYIAESKRFYMGKNGLLVSKEGNTFLSVKQQGSSKAQLVATSDVSSAVLWGYRPGDKAIVNRENGMVLEVGDQSS